MGCSTQPIDSAFERMDALHTAQIDYVRKHDLRTGQQLQAGAVSDANSQENLFRLVDLGQRPGRGDAVRGPTLAPETIHQLETSLELNREKAADLYRRMVYYCYSMAVMMATDKKHDCVMPFGIQAFIDKMRSTARAAASP